MSISFVATSVARYGDTIAVGKKSRQYKYEFESRYIEERDILLLIKKEIS